jgi:DNA-binding SARP family transcriptional activator/tetratricopeptide (TPR) repeat protein
VGLVEFRILGPLEVVAEAAPVALPRGRGRALLALLILRAGEVVSTERLVDELWGQTPPPTATTALRGLVSTLRRRLEPVRQAGQAPAVLQTCAPGYVLAVEWGQIDANRFRHLVEVAAGAPPQQRAALLREALSLWRGPALAEFTYEPFAQTAITALSELRLAALEGRIEADLALGRHAELVAELEGLAADYPLREHLRAQLMLALYRCGRQAEALNVYGDARRMLVEELGIEPGPALQGLEQAILRQDRSLDLQPAAHAAGALAGPARVETTAAAQPWLTQSRKTVTVVFVDLTEAAAAGGRSDPEALRRVVGRGVDVSAKALARHGGTVEGIIGDVVVGVFGVAVAHEDDAVRAVRAATELRGALAALNADLERERDTRLAARIGVNTGEVLVGDLGTQRAAASGNTVSVAARLQQAAADGEVLMGEATRRLVEDAVVVEPVDGPPLDGRGGQADAWRLVDLIPGALARAPRLDTPMVGRASELGRLRTIFDRTLREQRAVLVTVVGEAGVGKSRLALEFARALEGEAQILTGTCPSYGEGITFWPLREIVVQAVGDRGRDGIMALLAGEDDAASTATHVADAIGLSDVPTADGKELFPAVRRLFEALARRQPLMVVVDDAHWAQPTFLDLIDYVADSTGAAVLIVCLGRPEFLDERPVHAGDRENAETLRLTPLAPAASEKLVADRLAGRRVPDMIVKRVVGMAQGNPLFVEQLVAALRDEGELALPPSVQALLAARLDRLGPAERDVLRCAAVVGVDFSVQALTALLPDEARPFLDRHLQTLEDKELIRASGRPFVGATACNFRHVLIQRAAYRSMTHRTRAELHERFAQWLETDAGPSLLEFEEVVGYHLEQAYVHWRDLGLDDRRSRAFAARAGERLASAGLRAYRRLDVAGAESLLARARMLLPSDHPQRREVMHRLAEGYPLLGRHAEADAVLAEMLEEIGSGGDWRVERVLRLERARVRLFTGPDPTSLEAIRQEAEQALEMLEASGDHAGIAQASFVLGLLCRRSGAIAEMEVIARRGLAAAERSGHAREEGGARWNVAWAVQAGTTPVREAIRVCEELAPLKDTLHPGVLCELATLRAMLGQFDEARELIARTRRLMVERWRQRGPLMYPAAASGRVAILAGDLAAAERELRAAVEMATQMDVREHVSQLAAILSQVLTRLGHTEEAERYAAMSMDRAPAESVASQALWRAATARVRSNRQEPREAEGLARAAVQLAPLDMLNLRADLHTDLAEVLLVTGQPEAVLPVISEAAALYERKGNLVGAAQARALHTKIGRATDAKPRTAES